MTIGQKLGPYEIGAKLGEGGMGEVYHARDTRLKRAVALKVLRRSVIEVENAISRFEREAELLAALNHPNIAAIYGVEEQPGTTALVLEFVEGPTIADRLAAGPMPVRDVLAICRQIVDALDAAHERGIVHRDLKPANIKIREDGTVKVLDFGLGKLLDSPTDPARSSATVATVTSPVVTSFGVILGTAAYMSPEQARGQALDKRTDIWSFGCVVFEMLAGRRPFGGDTVTDTIAAVIEREPDWSALPSSTPPGLIRLLKRCLEKIRNRRLRDIGDVRHALDDIVDDVENTAPRPVARRGWWPIVAGAGALAVLGAITGALAVNRRSNPATAIGAAGPRFTRVTADAAFSTEPAISRDGTMVVYASDRGGDGQLDLFLQRIGRGQPIPLTDDAADDREPAFSPDGTLITFRSDRAGGGVYVMPVLGGTPRLIAEGGRRPVFSPDGSRIAYWTGPWLSGAGARGPGAVFTVPTNGGEYVRIGEGFATARDPVWAPDGRSLLFFGRKSQDDSPPESFDWWWAPLDGRSPMPTGVYSLIATRGLASPGDNDLVPASLEPIPKVWLPSGVVFSAGFGESVNLWRLAVSPATGQPDAASLARLTSGGGFDLSASADDAGRIAFQTSTESYVSLTLPLDANGGRPSGIIVRQTSWAGGGGRNSLDDAGRLLAYQRRRGNETELWVKELQTGAERHLVTTRVAHLNPVMAHDGSAVAYSVPDPDDSRVLGYVVPVAGGASRQVCECVVHGWSGDNQRIVALDGRGRSRRVRMIDIVDRTEVTLAESSTASIGRVDLSPDGRWLALSGSRGLWIAPVRPDNPPSESEWINVIDRSENSAERACGWSPDSRLLYLLLERDGFRDLYAQRIDAARGTPLGQPFVVQHLHDPRRRWGSSPFGSAIVRAAFVFSQVEITGSIWLLDPK